MIDGWKIMDKSAEDRINIALETLKNELIEMRSLDVKLMRQLLSINDTIHKLTKGNTMTRTQSCKSRISTKKSSRLCQVKDVTEKPIRRLQSTPSFCRLLNSGESFSSLADSTPNSVEYMFYFPESDEDLYVNAQNLQRCSSMSWIAPLDEDQTNDSCYEEILRANIKVWKSSKAEDSSVLKNIHSNESFA